MSYISRLAAATFLLLCAALASATELTDAAIHKMLAQVDDAIERRDARGVVSFMSPQARIVMIISARNQSQVIRLNRDEYLHYLEQGWAEMEDYRYQRQQLRIKHMDDGRRAQVSATVRESMTISGQLVASETQEEAVVEMIDGQPLLVDLRGQIAM